MRILAFAASFEPRIGGGEKYASRFLESLVDAGAAVDVVTTVDGIVGDRRVRGMNVHYVAASRVAGFPSFSLATVRHYGERTRCNVLQTFSPSVHDFIVAAYAFAKRIPLISVYHADLKDDKGVGFFATRLHNYSVLSVAHRILTTNATIAAKLRVRGIAGAKISSLVPGIDAEFFEDPPAGGEPELDVLFVGALDEYHAYKRLDLLFAAVVELIANGESVTVAVVGAGSRLEHYRSLAASLGLAERVTFVGFVSAEALPSFYRRARVLVLPSPTTQEGFGLVCLEAMASGTPVVCSRQAGAASIVASCAACALWDGSDIASLQAAILKARRATRPERDALVARMRPYSWSAMGRVLRDDVFAGLGA
ncbi:MAG: glycosyltransferase family 4 protein [Vulcanimicrobiaceae bacterium]